MQTADRAVFFKSFMGGSASFHLHFFCGGRIVFSRIAAISVEVPNSPVSNGSKGSRTDMLRAA